MYHYTLFTSKLAYQCHVQENMGILAMLLGAVAGGIPL
jgi:hypothetical protein